MLLRASVEDVAEAQRLKAEALSIFASFAGFELTKGNTKVTETSSKSGMVISLRKPSSWCLACWRKLNPTGSS